MSKVELIGIPELTAAIKKALSNHSENEVRKSLKRGAQVIADEAKSNVVEKTGLLKKSIMVLPKWRRDPLGMYVGPKVKRRRKKKEGQAEQPFYAHFVEYGTAAHNLGYKGKFVSGKGADHPGTKPKPYMRPAYDTKAQEALNIAMQDILKLIESKANG